MKKPADIKCLSYLNPGDISAEILSDFSFEINLVILNQDSLKKGGAEKSVSIIAQPLVMNISAEQFLFLLSVYSQNFSAPVPLGDCIIIFFMF